MSAAGRRAVASAAAALAGALLLASCGGTDDSGSSDPQTLRLWHYEGPTSAMGVAWAEAIKEFEAQHPGVKVKFEEKSFPVRTARPSSTVTARSTAPMARSRFLKARLSPSTGSTQRQSLGRWE